MISIAKLIISDKPPYYLFPAHLGFKDQEDGEILEGEDRSVRGRYVSTEAFGSSTYSTSNKLQSPTSSSMPINIKAEPLGFQDQEDEMILESE